MIPESGADQRQKGFIELRPGGARQIHREREIGRPDADIHRAHPVHAKTGRILHDEVDDLRANLAFHPRTHSRGCRLQPGCKRREVL